MNDDSEIIFYLMTICINMNLAQDNARNKLRNSVHKPSLDEVHNILDSVSSSGPEKKLGNSNNKSIFFFGRIVYHFSVYD